MNIQNLKPRLLLLVFMLLRSSNAGKLEFDLEIPTKLLPKLNNTWPGYVTNGSTTEKPAIHDKSITSAKTLVVAGKKIQID